MTKRTDIPFRCSLPVSSPQSSHQASPSHRSHPTSREQCRQHQLQRQSHAPWLIIQRRIDHLGRKIACEFLVFVSAFQSFGFGSACPESRRGVVWYRMAPAHGVIQDMPSHRVRSFHGNRCIRDIRSEKTRDFCSKETVGRI